MDILFGATEHTEVIDVNGSTKTVETKYKNGLTAKPVRVRYEIRHRTDKTNVDKVSEIARLLLDDFTKLDATLKLEKTKSGELEGYYNLVEAYTVLEY